MQRLTETAAYKQEATAFDDYLPLSWLMKASRLRPWLTPVSLQVSKSISILLYQLRHRWWDKRFNQRALRPPNTLRMWH